LNDSELRDIYAKSHLFILPSLKSEDGFHEETQGVVLQEAQAVGLITLATKTGGIPECIDDGVSGFLVEDRSAEAIADKLSTLISESDKWSTYQKAGRKWVEDRYDIDVIGKKINAIYKSLIVSG
jgi:glycosyltransferase involved in cell wall biosynthesis